MPLIKSVKQSAVRQNTEELIQSGRDLSKPMRLPRMYNVVP